jgi:serine/threonine-protein kinase
MLSSGVTLGQRYELQEWVGEGGFSEVWRALDLTLERPVAVKVLHPGYVQDAKALARFQAEARHAGSLTHENIARVYDYGEPRPPYLVMELVGGLSLAQVLASGPLDPVRAMDVVAQTAAGLQAAHSAGLVHRDIKPGNLLLAPDGTVKITDFGIAYALGSAGVTNTGLVLGTPGYLAPERVAGASATALSDLYSLGVVAYECLTGVLPFDGTGLEVALAHAGRPFPALPAFVPADVGALVMQLTAKDPADRPDSAAEVAVQARQLRHRLVSEPNPVAGWSASLPGPASGAGRADRPVARGSRWHPGRVRRPVAASAAAVAVIALLVVVGVNIGSPKSAHHAAAAPSAGATRPASGTTRPTTPAVVTVDVDSDSMVGQPVTVVVRELRQQGLDPRVIWQPDGQQQPGHVTAIWPAGKRPVGSLVTVVGALRVLAGSVQASQPSSHGNGNGNGKHKGNGNGKGNGEGNGKGHGDG